MTLSLLAIFSSCQHDDDQEGILSVLQPSDIIMGPNLIEYSAKWLTDGQTLQITINDVDYSTTAADVKLTTIKIEKDGELIKEVPYKQHSTIDLKVNKWNHGDNTIRLVAIFQSNNGEVDKEIRSSNFIVFNELPHYDIEGYYTDEVTFVSTSGEIFYHFFQDESVNHVFSKCLETKDVASSGEVFYWISKPKNPSFFINKDVTNFDANITKVELHWNTPDGPANLAEEEDLTYPVYLYPHFSVSGVHEGIAISQESTIGFSFIKKSK